MDKIPSHNLYHARMRVNEARSDLRQYIKNEMADKVELEMLLQTLDEAQEFLNHIKEA